MRRRSAIAALASLGAAPARAKAADPPGPTPTGRLPALAAVPEESLRPLVAQALPGLPGKRFTAVIVDFPPGAAALPHRHGHAFLYAHVLEGEVLSQLAGEPVRSYRTGEGWTEQPGVHHLRTENASRTAPARLLVTFVSNEGEALKTTDPDR